MDNSEFVIVFSSAGSQIEASSIADVLLEKKLAACVSVIPGVTSYFIWKDKKETSFEVLMIIKSQRDKFAELKDTIIEMHSYEVPEILMVPLDGGSEKYMSWMKLEMK